MKSRKQLGIALLIAVGVLAAVLVSFFLWKPERPDDQPNQTVNVPTTEAPNHEAVTADPTQEVTVPATTEPLPSEAVTEPKPSRPTEPAYDDPPPQIMETDPPAETVEPYIQFPYAIPGTSLVITQLNAYDGIFLENGSDEIVENVSAIVLMNLGSKNAEYVNITMDRDGTPLQFVASGLAAGGSAVVLEYNCMEHAEGSYSNCTADVATVDVFEMSEGLVRVEENENGGLVVTNISQEDIPCVRVFYKFYMYDVDAYVGGITYTAKLVDLAAGTSQAIIPSHYTAGMSKVIMVKTYETADE